MPVTHSFAVVAILCAVLKTNLSGLCIAHEVRADMAIERSPGFDFSLLATLTRCL
jgi:hypothetical protein